MDVQVRLPTRDRSVALEFLSTPRLIVESTWDANKIKQLGKDKYLLIMPTFPLPGIDNITPEIEVDFLYTNETIVMRSGNWTLRGTSGGIVKDSRFMSSFEISIGGELKLSPAAAAANDIVSSIGWVEYRVQGTKPTIFRQAPSFVLNSTIMIIKDSVAVFVERVFAARLLSAFRSFMLNKR